MQGMTYTEIFSKGAMIVGGTLVAGGCIPEGFGADFIIHSGNNTNTTLPADSPDKHDLGIILVASGGAAQLLGGVLFFGGFLVHKCFVKPAINNEHSRLIENVKPTANPEGEGTNFEITIEEKKFQQQEKQKKEIKLTIDTGGSTPPAAPVGDSEATSITLTGSESSTLHTWEEEEGQKLQPIRRNTQTLTPEGATNSREYGESD